MIKNNCPICKSTNIIMKYSKVTDINFKTTNECFSLYECKNCEALKQISTYRNGGLEWHPAGSCFTGAGITEKGILFSYHADWKSAGRWGIDIMTDKSIYRLMPLEKLYRCQKKNVNWEEIPVTSAYPDCKTGVAEEIAIMLYPELESLFPLITLEKGIQFMKLAEAIFGYYSRPSK